ncbi:MAG: alkaline phosphatase family protein [Thermoanaerobaculia bacterium]
MKCLAVLIDALNPLYLDYMPALRRMQEASISGRFREPLGFTPREAYFGGLTPNETGYTHMFRMHADSTFNPFSIARHFPESARPELDHMQSYLQPAFAALYARTLAIPWHFLPYFVVSERYSPWDPRKGYESIFDRLNAQKRSWSYVGWPFQQKPDRELQGHALDALASNPDFLFVHFSEMDSTGHIHGPHSVEAMQAATRTDQLLEELLERADGYSLLVFGDHGMVPVTEYLRLDPRALSGDILYFIDSTSIRLWGDPDAVAGAREYLRTQDGLFEMDKAMARRYAAERVPNGLVFWAHPGVVLDPNFFGEGKVRGMHGYLPDVFDNESMFAARAHEGAQHRHVQAIDAVTVHEILGWFLGLRNAPQFTDERRPAFTRATGGDDVVQKAVDTVVDSVREHLPEVTALHLCGSFGRAEGTVRGERLVNDLDLVYESAVPIAVERINRVSSLLCSALSLPFVDLSAPPDPGPSQYAYEYRYGTHTLLGSAQARVERPHMSSGEVPQAAFGLLLLNRIAGYHSSFCEPYVRQHGYRDIQIVKLGLALAQEVLSERGAYHYSYFVCQQRLALLPQALRGPVAICFEWKLAGRELAPGEADAILDAVRNHIGERRPPEIEFDRRSLRGWRARALYRRLYQTFMNRRPVDPADISAWFRIIHPQ